MASKRESAKEFSPKLLILAIVLLLNPQINILDYLPDFIGCFIISSALGYFADRAPYFEEAKSAFIKLGILSLAKIPSFIIMTRIISNNMRESDARALFTLVFAVIELVLAINVISNLFSALSYLGQRTEAASLIVPFKISKRKSISAGGLRLLCYVFAVCKSALNLLPELLLLTNSEASLNPGYFNPALLYPYAILISFVTVFVFGIVCSVLLAGYVKEIYREGKIFSEADRLIDDARRGEMERNKKIKGLRLFLSLMTASGLFLFDFASQKLGNVNLIPDFLFGIFLIITFAASHSSVKGAGKIFASAGIFSVLSMLKYVFEILFLNSFTYEQLTVSASAEAKYLPVIVSSVLEFFALALLLWLVALRLMKFIRKHVGASPKSEGYGALDRELQDRMKKTCIGWAALGILLGLVKLTVTLTRGHISGLSPLSFVFCLAFTAYGYYLFGKIKEEIQNKYS